MDEKTQRDQVVSAALGWLRTPYHENAQLKGAGVDCAMFPRAVYQEAIGLVIDFDPYSPQWFLHQAEERYVDKVLEFAKEIDEARAGIGDLVLFRIGKLFAHGALIMPPGWPRIIHANKGAKCVVEATVAGSALASRDRRFFSVW